MKLRAIKIPLTMIPEFNGNRELSTEEQVKIHFVRIPGTSEKANYKGLKFEQTGAFQMVNNDNSIISIFISKIENLEFDDGSKIRTGAQLATATNPGLEPLFKEIRDYLFPDEEEDFTQGESPA